VGELAAAGHAAMKDIITKQVEAGVDIGTMANSSATRFSSISAIA